MLDYSILAWGLQEISDDDPTLLECADADANGVEFGGLAGGGRACVGVGEPVTHANQVTTLCSRRLNWDFAGFVKIVLTATLSGPGVKTIDILTTSIGIGDQSFHQDPFNKI